ncbi:hypothetical protein GGR57DRAFT_243698 [Xylariaceae sp. FL1272]|nr:hypothetical protein GGR57DRAFT_243698 [Xylariaceae sp. FL1272]
MVICVPSSAVVLTPYRQAEPDANLTELGNHNIPKIPTQASPQSQRRFTMSLPIPLSLTRRIISSGVTCVPTGEFHRFNQLPAEIRLQIWECYARLPRTIFVDKHSPGCPRRSRNCRCCRLPKKLSKSVHGLHVCTIVYRFASPLFFISPESHHVAKKQAWITVYTHNEAQEDGLARHLNRMMFGEQDNIRILCSEKDIIVMGHTDGTHRRRVLMASAMREECIQQGLWDLDNPKWVTTNWYRMWELVRRKDRPRFQRSPSHIYHRHDADYHYRYLDNVEEKRLDFEKITKNLKNAMAARRGAMKKFAVAVDVLKQIGEARKGPCHNTEDTQELRDGWANLVCYWRDQVREWKREVGFWMGELDFCNDRQTSFVQRKVLHQAMWSRYAVRRSGANLYD